MITRRFELFTKPDRLTFVNKQIGYYNIPVVSLFTTFSFFSFNQRMEAVQANFVTWTRDVFLTKDNTVARVRKAGMEMVKPALVSICKL